MSTKLNLNMDVNLSYSGDLESLAPLVDTVIGNLVSTLMVAKS